MITRSNTPCEKAAPKAHTRRRFGHKTTMGNVRSQSGSLQDALARIDAEFTVDTTQLKQITERFVEELSEGLERPEQNLVRREMASVLAHGSDR